MTTPQLDPQEFERLRQRVAELEARTAPRPQRRGWAVLAGAVVLVVGATAAASAPCSNGIPFCFAANEPAMASEINTNFAQLKTWLETKVGPTSASTVTASGLRVTGPASGAAPLAVTGSITDGTGNTGGYEFKNAAGTLGLGLGGNTVYATGSTANQPLQLKALGTGYVNALSYVNATQGALVQNGLTVNGASTLNGSLTVSGAFMEAQQAQGNGVTSVGVYCSAGRRIAFAIGWTNDNNSACSTVDRQARCANVLPQQNCIGQTQCIYSGSANGCGNPGNTCLYAVCM